MSDLNNGTAQKFSASAFSFTSDPIISISTSTGVINITLPGHRLDPGWIARDAVVMYGSRIYIRTAIEQPGELVEHTASDIIL
jgi:hypothetical protein